MRWSWCACACLHGTHETRRKCMKRHIGGLCAFAISCNARRSIASSSIMSFISLPNETKLWGHWIHMDLCQIFFLNLPILINNHELDNIVMNKGWIHGELRYFCGISWSSIKSDHELRWEIRGFDIFRKITQRKIYGIQNHRI